MSTGRVTVPTDIDVIEDTIEIIKKWKADAIRDCDGTDMPETLRKIHVYVSKSWNISTKINSK